MSHPFDATLKHYGVPVRTIVMLLRAAAEHPHLTGRLAYQCGHSR